MAIILFSGEMQLKKNNTRKASGSKFTYLNDYKFVFVIVVTLLIAMPILIIRGQNNLDYITIPIFFMIAIGTVWGFIQLRSSKENDD